MPDLIPAEILSDCILPPPAMPTVYVLWGFNLRSGQWQWVGTQPVGGYRSVESAMAGAASFSERHYSRIRVVRIGGSA